MSTPLEKPQIIAHIQKGLNYTIFDSKWIPCSAKFVCMGNFARGTGVIQVYEVQHGEVQLIKEIEKAKPFKCGTFGATSLQQRHLATGDFGGNLNICEYPAQRSKKDADEIEMGVAGSASLLQNVTLSTQPIASLDWSPDKQGLCVCSAFDQTVRVLIVTKLNRV
ncbi:UNVERIFIED_CONTAM: hypothetical protein FKN15_056377 [Acipenser sinensis]